MHIMLPNISCNDRNILLEEIRHRKITETVTSSRSLFKAIFIELLMILTFFLSQFLKFIFDFFVSLPLNALSKYFVNSKVFFF